MPSNDVLVMIQEINRAIEDGHLDLTDWEVNFIESITQLAGDGRPLSEKQDAALEGLWRKAVNADGGIPEHEAEDD